LDEEVVGGKLRERKDKFFDSRKLEELRQRQIAAVKYLNSVVEERTPPV